MKISKRMKFASILIGITGFLVVALLVVFIAFMIYVGSDVLSGQATASETLMPDGIVTGKALVVYNPGLSGAPRDAALRVANDLKARGYEVMFAGVNSTAAADVSGYDVIVAGGPVYAGKVSPSIQSYLRALDPRDDTKVGAFAIGSNTDQPFPDVPWLKATAIMSSDKDMGPQVAIFVGQLLK